MSQPYLRRNLHLQPEKHQASTTTVRELICVYAANAQNMPNMQSDVTDLDFLESVLVSFPTVETWAIANYSVLIYLHSARVPLAFPPQ